MSLNFTANLLKSCILLRPIICRQIKNVYFYNRWIYTNNTIICMPHRFPEKLYRNIIIVRHYAKGKDKKKSDKGKKNAVIDETVLSGVIDNEKLHSQLQSCIDHLKEDYVKNLSLRSTTGSIETLSVKFDGSEYKLQELAQIIRQNPKSVILNMSSFPQAIPAVLEALDKSGMNLNPQQDGTKLFIPVPKVTKELRENLAKSAKALFIKCKGNIKDVQNKYIKTVKTKEKTDSLSKDDSHNATHQVTLLCDKYVAQAENVYTNKETELLKGN